MKIQELLINFNDYLKKSWSFLRNVGIERGMDEWDDWVETSYNILVLNQIREMSGRTIGIDYGVWPLKTNCKSLIVKIKPDTELLFANDKKNNFKQEILHNEDVTFSFREFNHPFISEDDIKAFDYTFGEIIERNYYEEGTKICVPIEYCDFLEISG